MADKYKIPEDFVKEGLEVAAGTLLFGVPIEELSKEEFLAAAANGWKAYNDQLKSSIRSFEIMSALRSAGGVNDRR